MNTNSNNYEELKSRIKSLKDSKTEEQKLEEDSFVLMANYLSEIERFQKMNKINRKELAKKIGTSASYLTQVFRGDKPLNFITISKMRKALGLVFVTRAYPKDSFKGLDMYYNAISYSSHSSKPNCEVITMFVGDSELSKVSGGATIISVNYKGEPTTR